jgi:hypothetical protein
MSMDTFNCDTYELHFRFEPGDIDRDAFLKAVSDAPYIDENINEEEAIDVALSFGSKEQPPKLHSHLRVRVDKEKGRADLSYHESPLKVDDVKPPYAEDCARWLGEFFKVEKIEAFESASFRFDKSFSSVVTFPFPLVTSEKPLAGALVTGMSIIIPKEPSPLMAIMQSAGEEITVYLTTKFEVNLREFDLLTALKGLSKSVRNLVKKRKEADSETGAAKNTE